MNQDKIVLLFILILTPIFILANAGSPMMWFGMLHLVWINAIIGTYENRILNIKFGIANRKWLIILANYVSMFIGLYFIAPHFSAINGNVDFWGGNTRLGDYKLKGFLAGMFFSFIATLIIEFPFYLISLKTKLIGWNLFKPFLVINSISNLIMLMIYLAIVIYESKWN